MRKNTNVHVNEQNGLISIKFAETDTQTLCIELNENTMTSFTNTMIRFANTMISFLLAWRSSEQ